jgi:hypothetical protein
MAERTLQDRYRLLAAAFRDAPASSALREHLGSGYAPAVDLVADVLAREVAAAPRDLDRERVASLLTTLLPGRMGGREAWARDVPDVVDAFLAFVAQEESLSTGWEWTTAVEESRPAFEAALEDESRPRFGGAKEKPDRRPAPKIGRNEPCFCGSGKKYKHCCLKLAP